MFLDKENFITLASRIWLFFNVHHYEFYNKYFVESLCGNAYIQCSLIPVYILRWNISCISGKTIYQTVRNKMVLFQLYIILFLSKLCSIMILQDGIICESIIIMTALIRAFTFMYHYGLKKPCYRVCIYMDFLKFVPLCNISELNYFITHNAVC